MGFIKHIIMIRRQVFLFHFAGGNCYSFELLMPLLKEFDVRVLELPGRGKRVHQSLLKDFDVAARDMYDQVVKNLTSAPFIIYGHSMGAYLALRVTGMLEKTGRVPAYLIVSGNAGPAVRDLKRRYLMKHDEFVEELKFLGGVPVELLENTDLFNYFDPILRADFEIAENNRMANEPPVKAPLYAMMGDKEEKVAEISNWGRFTKSTFKYEVLEGDHFFINKHPQRIAAIIKDCFTASPILQHR